MMSRCYDARARLPSEHRPDAFVSSHTNNNSSTLPPPTSKIAHRQIITTVATQLNFGQTVIYTYFNLRHTVSRCHGSGQYMFVCLRSYLLQKKPDRIAATQDNTYSLLGGCIIRVLVGNLPAMPSCAGTHDLISGFFCNTRV
jgi:hypothetical protein